MVKKRLWKEEFKFHLKLQVLIVIFVTLSSYVYIPFGGVKALLVYFIHFLLLQFSVFGFVYMLSVFKKIFLVLFPLTFLVFTSLSFWVYTQDVTIALGLIQAILETKTDIAIDTISIQFLAFVLISLIPLFFLMKRFKKLKTNGVKSPLFFLAIFGIITFFVVEHYKFGTFKRKLPYNAYFGLVDYIKTSNLELNEVVEDVVSTEKNIEIIFVLGESVRADHLGLNGYYRNTTPLLALQKNIVSFKNIYTPLTYTAISVPQILTNKSITDVNYKKWASVYSVLHKADFKTTWLGNQTLEKSYQKIVQTNDTVKIIDKFHSVLSFKKEKDMELLDFFEDEKIEENKITTLHMIGSHWYYNSRISKEFEQYTPIVKSKYVGSSTAEELINSYDNTILYLDSFLNTLIHKLKKSSKKTILIYLSDHGETLGEDGKWFHAQEHEASKNPAMLVWFSDNFKNSYPLKIENLKVKKSDSITTDFLFHSIIDLSGIKNFKFDKAKSIFN